MMVLIVIQNWDFLIRKKNIYININIFFIQNVDLLKKMESDGKSTLDFGRKWSQPIKSNPFIT